MPPKQTVRIIIKALLNVVVGVGFLAFLGELAMGAGLFGPMRSANWAPGDTAEAVHLPDGRYAILLHSVFRIQVYSADLQFLYGWNTGAFDSNDLRLSADGKLELYASQRHSAHL